MSNPIYPDCMRKLTFQMGVGLRPLFCSSHCPDHLLPWQHGWSLCLRHHCRQEGEEIYHDAFTFNCKFLGYTIRKLCRWHSRMYRPLNLNGSNVWWPICSDNNTKWQHHGIFQLVVSSAISCLSDYFALWTAARFFVGASTLAMNTCISVYMVENAEAR